MFTRLDVAASQIVITRPLLLEGADFPARLDLPSSSLDEINNTLGDILTAGFKLVRYAWMCPAGALYEKLRQRHLQEL
ncbi:hypothetical protein ONS96_013242 [Cadophora gregata f. sp. sojae]|nr:hypothetical protein ONS96_013242 [Cadophora gregata f. sp. sojae]